MTRSEKDEGKRFSSRFWRIFVLFLYYLGAWRRSRPPSDYTRWHAFLVRTYTQHICSTRRHYADPFLPMTEQLIARTVSGIYASKTKEKDIGEKSIVVLSTFFKMGGKKRVWQQSNWLEDTRLWLMLVCEKEGNKRSPPTPFPPTPIYNSWSIDELLEWPHSRVSNRSILLWCVYILGRFTAHRLSLMLSFY